jgi:hypothetical protein
MLKTASVFGQQKSLILLMYFNRVHLYVWTKKSLELAGEFGKQPDAGFLHLLDDYPDNPVIIVTDYLEESFRHDTGVHVTGLDRKALLERKLNYSFRNTPYRAATIVGRESEGRKDDKILMSALTKPEMLEPWVKLLLEQKKQIQCVTSVAYLMQAYSHQAGLNDKNLMIVSIEEGSELRQTFLRNGKIQFSRLTSLTTKESSFLPDAINHESLQIRQYLERIKLLPFDSQMVIRVFTPLQIDAISLETHNNELNTFQVFNIRDQAESFALTIDGLDRSPTTLFLGRILQRTRLVNIYAPLQTRKYFQLQSLADGLKTAGIALVVVTILSKSFSFIDTLGNWDLVQNLLQQTAPLNRQYEQLTQRFPETPIPSAEMALVVETAEHININSYRIENALTFISRALSVAPELRLTKISWAMVVKEVDPGDEFAAFGSSFGAPAPQQTGQPIQQATLNDMTQVNFTIEGLAFSPQSYREAQNQVMLFMTALDQAPGMSVITSQMPTDVRVDATVSTLVDNNALQAPFTLVLELEAQR